MATGVLTRQFLCSARITPAHFRSLCVLQRTLQFNPLFAIAARAASTATAKKTTSKTTASKPGPKPKAAAKKPGPKPKATAAKGKATKKAAPKKTATKKTAVKKKKPVAKKPVKKVAPKRKKKVEPTPEQARFRLVRELRQRALDPPKRGQSNGYVLWVIEQGGPGLETAEKWKSLPQETKDTYKEKAAQAVPAQNKVLEEWIASRPVMEIYRANLARRRLRKLGVKGNTGQLPDNRLPKRPAPAYMLYIQEQYRLGRELGKPENKKHAVIENGKLLREEFLNLSAAEKKKYEDMALENREKYTAERARMK